MFKVYKNLSWFFKQEWKQYILIAIMLVLISFLAVIPTRIIGEVIDKIHTNTLDTTKLTQSIVLLVLVPLIMYFLHYFFHYLIHREKQLLAYEVRKRYLNKLFDLDASIYEAYSKGELYTRITNDLEAIAVSATTMLEEILSHGSLLLFTLLSMILTINLKLTIASLLLLPFAFIFFFRAVYRVHHLYKEQREVYATMADKMLESIDGVKVVRAYTEERSEVEKLHETIESNERAWQRIVKFESYFKTAFNLVYAICFGIAFIYGTYLVVNLQMSVGQLVSFTIYLGTLKNPLLSINTIFSEGLNAIISDERLTDILKKESEVSRVDDGDCCELVNFESLQFDHVYFKYPFDEHYALEDINLTINKGETIGIVGPTGAGKSTLIRQLFRQFNLTKGKILLNGLPIENYRNEQVRQLVGYVPQSKYLFGDSFDESILIGNPDAKEEQIHYALDFAGLQDEYDRLQSGLHHKINHKGSSLSGGEKQRLAIARAMVRRPKILILDDSLSSLDADSEKKLVDNIREKRKGKTNIIVTKQFGAVKDAHRIIVLDKGKIVAQGTHEELYEQNKWYRHHYNIQIGKEE